jgi:hypothetical protein
MGAHGGGGSQPASTTHVPAAHEAWSQAGWWSQHSLHVAGGQSPSSMHCGQAGVPSAQVPS